MHYFPNRKIAGDLLAYKLTKYRYEDCAVVALSDGGVVVGSHIAAWLHCPLTLLMTESIRLLGEHDVLAAIDHTGDVTYNDMYSVGELEELKSENFNYIEQQKLEKLFSMNRLLGDGGVIDPKLLYGRHIIVVSDGLTSGLSMRAAAEYLKSIKTRRTIMVTPFASIGAVDQMHILADEIVCLNVLDEVISIDHYYDDNELPSHEKIIKIIEDIVLHWK